MVKGISRQVIVVHSPDPKLFDQAIFILKDDALEHGGVTEEALMKEAKDLINLSESSSPRPWFYGPVWGICGAILACACWALAIIL